MKTIDLDTYLPDQDMLSLEDIAIALKRAMYEKRMNTATEPGVQAITFAVEKIEDHYDRLEFLKGWLHGDTSEWPEFKVKGEEMGHYASEMDGSPGPNHVSNTKPARDGIEAQHGLNDVFPGDPVADDKPKSGTFHPHGARCPSASDSPSTKP